MPLPLATGIRSASGARPCRRPHRGRGRPAQLVALDHAFHSLITSHCGNAVLAAVIQNMAGRTVRARVWRGMTEPGAVMRTHAEHRSIYCALVAGDRDRARIHAAAHIVSVEDALLEVRRAVS